MTLKGSVPTLASVSDKRIILFELNEVPFRVIDDFVSKRPDSSFSYALSRSSQYRTHAPDATLSPWITWPTVHRGVDQSVHGIEQLGQDVSVVDQQHPPLWQTLAGRGIRVGVFGSLHSYPVPGDLKGYSFYVPDTFAADASCFPSSVDAFQRLNLHLARASARNVSRQIPFRDALDVVRHLPSLGLGSRTLWELAYQIVTERVRPWTRIRRRTMQAVAGFDVFYRLLSKKTPAVATFFSNHVASSMHRYWAATYPDDYAVNEFSTEWRDRYTGEIDRAMQHADRMLGRLIRFAQGDQRYSVWVLSSMGQAASEARPMLTQLYITDVKRFVTALGVGSVSQWEQRASMLPVTSLYITDGSARHTFRESLLALRLAGQPVEWDERGAGFFSITLGQPNLANDDIKAQVGAVAYAPEQIGISAVEIEDQAASSGYHVPEGSLVAYDPADQAPDRSRREISTTDILRMILDVVGLPPALDADPVSVT